MEGSGFKDGAAVLQAIFKNGQGQTISFQGIEEHCSSAIFSTDVKVEVGATNHTSGSSAITTRNITNYPWEHYYFPGSLVASHCSGEYIAYAIKAPQKSTGMVRIINRKSGDRGLVKNIRGMVRDLAFAHMSNRVILAFTDQYGTLSVIEVTPTTEASLGTEMLLEVRSEADKPSDSHRVIWCPYIPDDQGSGDEGDDPAFLLVLTRGTTAEVWKINVILREHESVHISREDVTSGYQLIEQHSSPITAAAFSPDGTALATAALDGFVKFFQVYMADEEGSPRCLHKWNPHDGKPLSALFFLDNHKRHSPELACKAGGAFSTNGGRGNFGCRAENKNSPSGSSNVLSSVSGRVQFWKYAVTGASNNSELKVWSCESWQCHQTLRFIPAQREAPPPSFAFKAAMDPSANFLLLSDIHRRVMYVIAISQDGNSTVGGVSSGLRASPGIKNGSGSSGSARMVSITELPVQYPALSLAVTDAAWKPYKRWKHDHAHDHAHNILDDGDDDDGDSFDVVGGVVVRCVLINTKSLQEATMRFQPAMAVTAPPPSSAGALDLSVSQDSIVVRDGLSDLSLTLNSTVSEGNGTVNSSSGGVENQPPPPPPPDALTSPQNSALPSQQSALTPPATQPPMNLLTPDSFSSPRKPEESEMTEDNPEEVKRGNKVVTPVSSKYDASFKSEFESAALSLLLRCGSGTLMPGGEAENGNGLNILGSVVAGTSKSPVPTPLPPPPSETPPPHGLKQNSEDAPLATSEVVVPPVVRAGTSATSSPSLEVQQILHSENGKSGDYAEDEDEDIRGPEEVEMAEDDDIDDEEEEEEPEALRQSHSHAQPPPLPIPDSQSLPQPQQPSKPLPQPPPLPQSSPVSQPLQSLAEPPQAAVTQQPKPMIPQKSPLLSEALHAQNSQSLLDSDSQQSNSSSQPIAISGLQSKRARNYMPPAKGETIMRSVSESRVLHMDQALLNGPVTPGVSAADITELRNLMMTCINISQEQNKEALTQTKEALSQTLTLATKLDKAIQQVNQLAKQVEEMRAAQSHVHMELPHVVASSIRPVVESTLRGEMRSTVLPGVIKSLEPVKSQVSQEVHGLTRNAEGQVIDTVSKLVHSRTFMDSLGSTVSSVMVPTVQNSCREAYNKMLLPGINALTQQVFTQVNDSFSRGTREYMQNVETEVQTGRAAIQESFTKASHNLNSACSALGAQTKTLQENINKLSLQQNTISDAVCDRIKSLVREEVSRALQEHQANVDAKSRAHTPAPPAHPHNPKVAQQQVQSLISSGQFNTAFKQALSASDLGLVVFVCERVNPQQVFNMNPCPLSQDVLLSLVNQLSHDLSTFTDLKLKYLEEAVMNLEPSHPVTREHMRHVLQGFQRNLNTFLAANPNHKKVKMLLMAVNHLAAS
ncbi:enhancer of mRNA-decapping protein 4-like isoform X2 [Macrobrachium nipponense]|uniref:enhancer of mRNA-decapping protein 4-like isoform X2 n=1 Tax=Macrobrachium nipponense TaxID=159736 RepID=UPI0030C7B1AE